MLSVAGGSRPSATTCFMSQGARNWPFLMLIARPVSAAASSRSVWRHRKAGICSTSTASADGRALLVLVHVGQHRHAEALAQLGQDRQALGQAEAARAVERRCGSPCRRRSCRSAPCRAWRVISTSAWHISRAWARLSSWQGRRSAPAAGRCRASNLPTDWRDACGDSWLLCAASLRPAATAATAAPMKEVNSGCGLERLRLQLRDGTARR